MQANEDQKTASTIELHTPTGVRHVELPERWSMHDLQIALELLQAVNYEAARPVTERAVVAYRPKPPSLVED